MTNNKQQQGTRLVDRIPLQALKTISLGFQGQEHTIRDCPANIFDAFVCQYSEVEDVNREVWSPFQRWRIINFLLEDKALEVGGDMLVEVDEDKSEVQPDFLEWVARARVIMRDNPGMNSAELAQALGLKSKLYAHQVKVFVNATAPPGEGA